MRLDFPAQQGQGSVGGLEELEQLIKASIKASFETRAAAYEEEVSIQPDALHKSPRHTLYRRSWKRETEGMALPSVIMGASGYNQRQPGKSPA